MEFDLAGKVALITGASRGIGKGIALELAAAGCDLMPTGRDAKALEAVAGEISALGRKAAVHVADLTAAGEPGGLTQALARHRSELDITRFGTPDDVAALVHFIVSPSGRWLHGSAIDADGGQVVPLRMSVYD
jgi:NAD(P)-dependent dehydrogenase (short-subunit alcohol dehydrogenase family)